MKLTWLGVVLLLQTACVFTSTARVGRTYSGGGSEGFVPVTYKLRNHDHVVAIIKAYGSDVGGYERKVKHIQRKGSLLGCTSVRIIQKYPDQSVIGQCILSLP